MTSTTRAAVRRHLAPPLLCAFGLAQAAQAQVYLGATGGAVHYDSQSTTSSFAFNPEIRLERPGLVFDLGGGYTAGSDGGRVGDGGLTLWAASRPSPSHLQLDGLFQGSVTRPQGDSASSALFGLGEIAYALADRGVAAGAGAVEGSIAGTPSVTALRGEVRGWYAMPDNNLTFTASIEPTRLDAATAYTELAGGAEWAPGAWDVSGGFRLRAATGATSLGGQGAIARDLTDRINTELDFGRYLRDPFQGLPPGYFVSLAFKVKLANLRARTGQGVSAAELGDVTLKAAERSFGFGRAGATTRRTTTSLPSAAGGGSASGRGTGNGHRP